MLQSIIRILGRSLLILLASAIVITLASGLLGLTAGQPRFQPQGSEGRQISPPGDANNNGQSARPPRRGGEENFNEGGSVFLGFAQLFIKALVIGVFTFLGVLVLNAFKQQRDSEGLPGPVEVP